jgi:hypothetical protein
MVAKPGDHRAQLRGVQCDAVIALRRARHFLDVGHRIGRQQLFADRCIEGGAENNMHEEDGSLG